jgi:hypothetical protein
VFSGVRLNLNASWMKINAGAGTSHAYTST